MDGNNLGGTNERPKRKLDSDQPIKYVNGDKKCRFGYVAESHPHFQPAGALINLFVLAYRSARENERQSTTNVEVFAIEPLLRLVLDYLGRCPNWIKSNEHLYQYQWTAWASYCGPVVSEKLYRTEKQALIVGLTSQSSDYQFDRYFCKNAEDGNPFADCKARYEKAKEKLQYEACMHIERCFVLPLAENAMAVYLNQLSIDELRIIKDVICDNFVLARHGGERTLTINSISIATED